MEHSRQPENNNKQETKCWIDNSSKSLQLLYLFLPSVLFCFVVEFLQSLPLNLFIDTGQPEGWLFLEIMKRWNCRFLPLDGRGGALVGDNLYWRTVSLVF